MLGALYREAGHLALHDPRRRAEPALGEELIADLDDGEPKSCVERVSGRAQALAHASARSPKRPGEADAVRIDAVVLGSVAGRLR